MSMHVDHADTASHVSFAGALNRWIERAGVADGDVRADLAVGMADILNAAAQAGRELEALMQLDPQRPDDADRALSTLAYLHVLFDHEIGGHLEDLRTRWSVLEQALCATAPPDPSDADESATS
jgi:hypothetical protein